MRAAPFRSAALVAALLLAAAAPALAADNGGHGSSGKSGKSNRYQANWSLEVEDEAPEADDSPSLIDMPMIVAPIVVDGYLVNYAFVSLRLDVADGNDPWKVREKTTYLRDALLRAAHAEALNPEGDPSGIDREKARRVWTAAANDVLGAEIVRDIRIMSIDTRYPDLAAPR